MLHAQSPTNPALEFIVGIIPGLLVFVFITNGVILNPSYTAWLTGDAFLAWQGWQFFRLSPMIQWPLGANPFFGLDISSSIVFPDSVPLMAFIFKPFTALLPTEFQYFGIFIFACFLLQSLYSYKILRLYSSTVLPAFFGSTLFVLAPILLVRLTETYQHHALFSQWVILAALYFYLRNKFSYTAWIALQVITLLINVYLFSMVFSVFLADLAQRKYLKQITTKTISILIPVTISSIIFIMWAVGFFMVGSPGAADGLSGGGFGVYRMNLLSPIDSNLIWSKLIPDIFTHTAEGEGFNFLGIGILSLLPIALLSLFQTRTIQKVISKKNAPLLILVIFCTIYALSNQIHIASHRLLGYEVPRFIGGIFNTFSSSGRFFWIPHYLFIIGIFCLIFKIKSKHLQLIVILGAILIQVADSSRATNEIKTHFIHPNKTFEKLNSDLWESFAKRYKKIIVVDPAHLQSPDILTIYDFASTHNMAVGANWQSKFNQTKIYNFKEKIMSSVIYNAYEDDSLYVFKNVELWDYAIDNLLPINRAFHFKNYKVIAPKFDSGINFVSSQNKVELFDKQPGHINLTASNPFVISLMPNGNFQAYRGIGWSHPEKDGTWTDTNSLSSIRINVGEKNMNDLKLSFAGKTFESGFNKTKEIKIYCNGVLLGNIITSNRTPYFNVSYTVKKSLIDSAGNNIFISVVPIKSFSSKILGLNNDNRMRGVQLKSITIETSNSASIR